MDLKHRWSLKATSPAALQKGPMEPWPRESGGKSPRFWWGLMGFYGGLMGFNMIYPLVNIHSLLLKMAIEIVDSLIKMVMFHSFLYVYQRVNGRNSWWISWGQQVDKLHNKLLRHSKPINLIPTEFHSIIFQRGRYTTWQIYWIWILHIITNYHQNQKNLDVLKPKIRKVLKKRPHDPCETTQMGGTCCGHKLPLFFWTCIWIFF